MEEQEKIKVQAKKKAVVESVVVKNEHKRKLTYAEQQEFKQIEAEIAALEAEKSALESDFAAGNLSADQVQQKAQRLQQLLPLLDEKEMRWLELSEISSKVIVRTFAYFKNNCEYCTIVLINIHLL